MGHTHADLDDEIHDLMIAGLTEKHLAARRAAVIAGDKKTTSEVCNSVLDYLSHAADLPELVIKSLTSARAVTGKTFGDVLEKVMRAEAECDAIMEIERIEQDAKTNPDNCKPKTRACAAFLEAAA